MARKFIKKYLPDPASVRENRFLKIFGQALHDPQLWHLTRYSVAQAFAVGIFCAFIPVPFQMVIAAGAAIALHANLLLSVALVWITNPLTMPVIFGFAYYVGSWFFPTPDKPFSFDLSFQWLAESLGTFWQPFLLGCFVCGVVFAILGHVFIRVFWRIYVVNQWKLRLLKRSQNQSED